MKRRASKGVKATPPKKARNARPAAQREQRVAGARREHQEKELSPRPVEGEEEVQDVGQKELPPQPVEEEEEEAPAFFVDTTANNRVRYRLQKEMERTQQQRQNTQQRLQLAAEQHRIAEALAWQTSSLIPPVPGTQLSNITVSAYRVVPLLTFAPPSSKCHTLLLRMRPNEVLCFYGRVQVRVFEGCLHVFGHHFFPSADYHTLSAPTSSGALRIEAVKPTEEMLQRQRGQVERPRAALPQTQPTYKQVSDEDIRNVLDAKRSAEQLASRKLGDTTTSAEWDDEVVVILRSFYEVNRLPTPLPPVLGDDGDASAERATAEEDEDGEQEALKQPQPQPLGLPRAPSQGMLRNRTLGHKIFIMPEQEDVHRRPPHLYVPPPVVDDESSSDGDDDDKGPAPDDIDIDVDGDVGGGSREGEGQSGTAADANMQVENGGANDAASAGGDDGRTRRAHEAGAESDGRRDGVEDDEEEDDESEREAEDAGEEPATAATSNTTASTATAATTTTTTTSTNTTTTTINPDVAHLLLSPETVRELVGHYLPLPGFYPVFPHRERIEEPTMNVPASWVALARDVTQMCDDVSIPEPGQQHPPQPPRVVITGKKNTGKSTLGQYLINALLERQRPPRGVAFLDIDLGQPEFTPAGLVSLHVVTAPVYGPAFDHLQEPLRAHFVGDISVEGVAEPFVHAVRSLVAHYYAAEVELPSKDGDDGVVTVPLARLPLIINTHGWLKSVGLEMLREVTECARPNVTAHLYLRPPGEAAATTLPANPLEDEYRFLRVHNLPVDIRARARMSVQAEELRTLRLEAYFNAWRARSLATQVPYRVPWNAIRLAFVEPHDVAPSECLLAFNASVVGLGVDSTNYLSCAPPGQPDLSRGQSPYPSLLLSSPLCECVGLGIVRTIDPVTHQFFVLTPVQPAQLQRVNTFLKGALHLPSSTLRTNGWLSSPYLVTHAIARPGSAKMTGRPGLLRKHVPAQRPLHLQHPRR